MSKYPQIALDNAQKWLDEGNGKFLCLALEFSNEELGPEIVGASWDIIKRIESVVGEHGVIEKWLDAKWGTDLNDSRKSEQHKQMMRRIRSWWMVWLRMQPEFAGD